MGDETRQPDEPVEEVLQRLFAGVLPREDRTDMELATPDGPPPWLVQQPKSVAALALATELLGAVVSRGGSSVAASTLGPLREQLRTRFDDSAWAHLQEELLHLLLWLEERFVAARDAPAPSDEERYDPAPRLALVEEAIREERDLYLEFLRVDEKGALRWHRIRVRPERVEIWDDNAELHASEDEADAHAAPPAPSQTLIAKIVPGGDRFTLALHQIRWLMKVRRFSPLQHVPMADVLAFPDPNAAK